jgi:glycosyltransferase involved in cell wall biosynthesis/GT2 family glycosyltransferase
VSRRFAVSVIVPFAGTEGDAQAVLAAFSKLSLGAGDEVILVDNTPDGKLAALAPEPSPQHVVLRATWEHSSYHARNAGAERASADWLLFIDADCRPDPDILDRYFDGPIDEGCAIVAGAVVGAPGQRGLIPGWARSRRQLSEDHLLQAGPPLPHPATGTGNMLVRRHAFDALGGFHEGVRSGADMEFCWRVQDAGWSLLHRPAARVEHHYTDAVGTLARQSIRHAAGRRWVSRRYAGAFAAPPILAQMARAIGGAVAWTVTLRPRRGLYKLIDGVTHVGAAWGWWLGRNGVRPAGEVRPRPTDRRSVVVVTDAFPARSETFVYNEALRLIKQGWALRVESLARPIRTERDVAREITIDYLEDDATRDKLRDLIWLVMRHPLRCLRDRRDARRWAAEEEVWGLSAIAPAARRLVTGGERHLHAHFAAGGALTAMRLSRLVGVPFSLTAHAYDIFQHPRNLREKIRSSAFSAAECNYAAAEMVAVAGPDTRAKVHRIATGTDASQFRRSEPYPGQGRVLAIGRLIEKKGFNHLIAAAELLRDDDHVAEVVIAGEGPLMRDLQMLVEAAGLDPFVRLLGPLWGPNAVRDLLETADVLAIPSVLAADGDRDALPLVAYEALAMEVPVVASDLVGLPELVRPPWGTLVEPGDPRALAAAIAAVLSTPAEDRVQAGAMGRAFVIEEFDPGRETLRLAELILSS